MALSTVMLVCDLVDGRGQPVSFGSVKLTPNTTLTDPGDQVIVTQQTLEVPFSAEGSPSVELLATDDAGLSPSGWTWGASFNVTGGPSSFSFFLPAGPVSFTATNASPAVFTFTPTTQLTELPNGTIVELSGGSLPAGFTAATPYYVVAASGHTFQLSVSDGGSAITSTSTGSGTLLVSQWRLSALTPTGTVGEVSDYLLAANNLLDVGNPSTALANLGGASTGAVASAQAAAIAASLPTLAQVSVSASGTLAVDTITEVTAASALTMTLPTATTGALIVVERASASTANVAVTGNIRGVAAQTITLSLASESEGFFGYGGSWWPAWGHKTLGSLDTRYQLMSSYAASGDLLYGTGAGTSGKLAGNTSAVQALLAQTGTGSASAAPVWMYPAAQTLPKPTGVAATDTAAIQTAENALNALGGGTLLFQPGTYVVNGLTKQSSVIWQGAGRFATIIQLANGANADVVQGANFGTLTLSGSKSGGIGGWAIRDLTIDGNKANQSGTSYCLRFYGYEFDITTVTLRNALTDGMYSEWGDGGGPSVPDQTMEARYTGLKIHDCGGNGWHNRGPHDSRAYDVTIFNNSTSGYGYWAEKQATNCTVAAGSNGVNVSTFTGSGTLSVSTTLGFPSASINSTQGSLTVATSGGTAVITYTGTTATTFTGCTTVSGTGTLSTGGAITPTGGYYAATLCLLQNVHVWGMPLWNYVLDASTDLNGCIGEVSSGAGGMALVRVGNCSITGGDYFILGGVSQNGCGIQIGDTANAVGSTYVRTLLSNFAGTSAATAPVNAANDGGGNDVSVAAYQATGSILVGGTPHVTSRYKVTVNGQGTTTDASLSTDWEGGSLVRYLPSTSNAWKLRDTSSTTSAADKLALDLSGTPPVLNHVNGLDDRWYTDAYTTLFFEINGSKAHVNARSGATGSLNPTVAAGAQATAATISSHSSDTAGFVTATVAASPAAGALAAVTFKNAFTNAPAVVLTPTNQYSAQVTAYVTVTTTGFTISAATTPTAAASQSAAWNYHVLGMDS